MGQNLFVDLSGGVVAVVGPVPQTSGVSSPTFSSESRSSSEAQFDLELTAKEVMTAYGDAIKQLASE